MSTFNKFQRSVIFNYIIGSMIAVFGVGSIFIFQTLNLETEEMVYFLIAMGSSVIIMLGCELYAYRRHVAPIAQAFKQESPSIDEIHTAIMATHKFPLLTVRRIIGPHFLGLAIPASSFLSVLIYLGELSIPYTYIAMAWSGGALIALLHALVEYFMADRAIRPIIKELNEKGMHLYGCDLGISENAGVTIKQKLFVSSLFTSTFPVLLFMMATKVRLGQGVDAGVEDYWSWASVIMVVILAVALGTSFFLNRSIQEPLEALQKRFGDVYKGEYERVENTYSDEFAYLASGFNHMVSGIKERDERNEEMLESFFTVIAATLDARDPYTAGHSKRVAEYSVQIAERAGFSAEDIDLLRKSALLHDIGKIGIRDDVLLKEGKLTVEEFEQIKGHPAIGSNILEQVELPKDLQPILPGVRYHHERYDGKGYPEGLKGEAIPVFGRLMAVADAYDAMTSDRPYRKGMSKEKALAIIEEGKGTQWDPYFSEIFLEMMQGKTQSDYLVSTF
ncbi:HD-GYP domain-containing protein [Thalassobacillus hwangdonensis]|uniref:HD-GYP domain-containing protein n=1 Tax=Thalassobacillus hwangdonensis TaxID=546108 RepID=A0ABW3L493_9BACI